ncbi:hypothetical protein PVAG01_11217 [Phlyctema vagabunda]|uniref:Uncharacterized protein n=1 Tax=Phlyctema vagabunda TaxID=108571 RepID=A0ABR4P218_9HELO
MRSPLPFIVVGAASLVQAQSNGCPDGYTYGNDTVLFTVPYSYPQVMSIIGSYGNLTWSGNPDGTVALNGSDNAVGTAREYDLVGAHIVETITEYSKPAEGPYFESHVLASVTLPSANLTAYSDYDATTVTSICGGRASTFNMTINFCANNAPMAAAVFHKLHLTDATTVGVFLGGQNFSSCAALNGTTQPTVTSSTSPPVATATISNGLSNLAPMGLLVVAGCGLILQLL